MSLSQRNIIGKRLVKSYLSSIVSISMVLLIAGFFALLVINARSVSNYFKENVRISVILKSNVEQEPARLFYDSLSRLSYVKAADFISKAEGTRQMEKMLGADFLKIFPSNPIPVSIDLRVDAAHFNKDSIEAISERLELKPCVDEVVYKNSVVEAINENIEKIAWVMLAFIAVLLFLALALINNTVRLNIYSKRFSIYTMRLVGARNSYIMKPFIGKAVMQGFVSGVIADSVLVLLLWYMERNYTRMFNALSASLSAYVLAGVVLCGVLICVACTYFIVGSMSSMDNDDLYV